MDMRLAFGALTTFALYVNVESINSHFIYYYSSPNCEEGTNLFNETFYNTGNCVLGAEGAYKEINCNGTHAMMFPFNDSNCTEPAAEPQVLHLACENNLFSENTSCQPPAS